MNSNLYYLLGVYTGDGSVALKRANKNGTNYYSGCIVVKDGQMYQSVVSLMKLVDSEISISEMHRESKVGGNCTQLSFNSQKVCVYLKDMCGLSGDKRVPTISNYRDCMDYVSGFIDSDGGASASDYSVYVANTVKSLMDSVSSYCSIYGIDTILREIKLSKSKQSAHPTWSPSVWYLKFRNQSLYKMDLNLQVSYKRDNFNKLCSIAKSNRVVEVDAEFIERNKDLLEKLVPSSSFYKLLNGKSNHIRYAVYIRCI